MCSSSFKSTGLIHCYQVVEVLGTVGVSGKSQGIMDGGINQGYRSMLNVPVILVGLADHARLVNTYIPSLD